MKDNTKHIIARLKQQPRQGMADNQNMIDAYKQGLADMTSEANKTIGITGKLTDTVRANAEAFLTAANKMNWYEEANKSLQKSYGLSIGKAAEFGFELDSLAEKFGVGGGELRKYQMQLKSVVGGFTVLSKNMKTSGYVKTLINTQKIIQTNLQLSDAQANKFIEYSSLLGTSSENQLLNFSKIAESLSTQTGMQISMRELVEDISSISGDLQLQYGKMPEKLALANIKAKMLGMTMADLNKTGQGFLNIESSIGDELEYQLLSGHRLVDQQGQSLTNAYRTATIQGESGEQARLMNQIVSQEGEVLRNNLFARQQMAKLLGTDEATLARTLSKQKILSDLGAEGLMDMTADQIQTNLMDNAAFKALDDDKKKELMDQLIRNEDTRTSDQIAADGIQKIVSEGVMLKFGTAQNANNLATQRSQQVVSNTEAVARANLTDLSAVAETDIVRELFSFTSAFGSATQMMTDAVSNLMTPEFKNPIKMRANEVVIETDADKLNDGVIGPGSGKVLFSGNEGAIKFNDNDYITASTNNPMSGGGGGADVAALAAAIVSAINKQTDELTSNSRMNGSYWS
jgi:hypothetical protein